MFQLLTLRLRCLEALLPESGQGKITAPLFQGEKARFTQGTMEFLMLQDGEAAVAEKLPELLPITTALLVDTSHEAKGEGWCGYGTFDWRHLCLKMELCMPVFPGKPRGHLGSLTVCEGP